MKEGRGRGREGERFTLRETAGVYIGFLRKIEWQDNATYPVRLKECALFIL